MSILRANETANTGYYFKSLLNQANILFKSLCANSNVFDHLSSIDSDNNADDVYEGEVLQAMAQAKNA